MNNTTSVGKLSIWKAGVVPQGATPITSERVNKMLTEYDDLNQHTIRFLIANSCEGLHAITIDSHTVYVGLNYPDCFNHFFTCPQLQNYNPFFKFRVLLMFFGELGKMERYVNMPFFVAARNHFEQELRNAQIPDTPEKLKDQEITQNDSEYEAFIQEYNSE